MVNDFILFRSHQHSLSWERLLIVLPRQVVTNQESQMTGHLKLIFHEIRASGGLRIVMQLPSVGLLCWEVGRMFHKLAKRSLSFAISMPRSASLHDAAQFILAISSWSNKGACRISVILFP